MANRKFGWHSGVAKAKMLELSPTDESEIAVPKAGDLIYDATANKLHVYTGSAWEEVTSA
jgi:hypothetical protein